MALRQGSTGHTAVSMGRASLRAVLITVLGVGMVFLVTSAVAVGVAIQRGAVAPPELDVRLGGAHLLAYVTHTPACARYLTPCPPELIASPSRDFYVVWVLMQTRQPAPSDAREIGTRILTLPSSRHDGSQR